MIREIGKLHALDQRRKADLWHVLIALDADYAKLHDPDFVGGRDVAEARDRAAQIPPTRCTGTG